MTMMWLYGVLKVGSIRSSTPWRRSSRDRRRSGWRAGHTPSLWHSRGLRRSCQLTRRRLFPSIRTWASPSLASLPMPDSLGNWKHNIPYYIKSPDLNIFVQTFQSVHEDRVSEPPLLAWRTAARLEAYWKPGQQAPNLHSALRPPALWRRPPCCWLWRKTSFSYCKIEFDFYFSIGIHRAKVRTSTRHARRPLSSIARQWLSALDPSLPERIWRSISTSFSTALWRIWSATASAPFVTRSPTKWSSPPKSVFKFVPRFLTFVFNFCAFILQNVSIGVVGKGLDFTIYDDAGVEPFLAGLEGEERRGGRPLPPDVEEELKVISSNKIVLFRYKKKD